MPEGDLSPLRRLFRPAFVVVVLVLGTAAFAIRPLIEERLGAAEKEPLDLRAPLGKLSKASLKPYKFVEAQILSVAMEEALGAREYIQWVLEDPTVEETDPTRVIRLLVTYYSGGRDLVPHVAEECMLGAGYQQLSADTVEIPAGGEGEAIPVRVLSFQKTAIYHNESVVVLYTFHANGEYATSRMGVRNLVSSFDSKYSYFCKVELSFGAASGKATPNPEQTVEAATRFLKVFMPVLLHEHLPDWEAVKAGDVPVVETEADASAA